MYLCTLCNLTKFSENLILISDKAFLRDCEEKYLLIDSDDYELSALTSSKLVLIFCSVL